MKSVIPERQGQLKLDDHRLIDNQTGEVVLHSPEPSYKKDRYYRKLADKNRPYFDASKKLGVIEKPTLAATAESAIVLAEESSDPSHFLLRSEAYELAASAVHELAFVETIQTPLDERADTVDERIQLIDEGDNLLKYAIHSLSFQPMTTQEQRLMLKLDFSNVMKDIVCGDVTDHTVEEIKELLEKHLLNTFNNVDSIHSRGLGGEIRAYLAIWDAYKQPGDKIAIPATVRGDSGLTRRNETHDIDTLSQDENGEWIVATPIEVKRRMIADWMLKRYTKSDLQQVRVGGNVITIQTAQQ